MAALLLIELKEWLLNNRDKIGKVVDFNPLSDRLCPLDFTTDNKELTDAILDDTSLFSGWVANKLHAANCLYGIGGYDEHRTIYNRSSHFDTGEEPRRLHLAVDIWGKAGTPVYNFYDGKSIVFRTMMVLETMAQRSFLNTILADLFYMFFMGT